MKIASVAVVKAQFSSFVRDTVKGLVVVTRNGKAVAVMLPVRDDDELERLVLANSPKLQAILEKSRRQIRAGQGIGHDEFWRQMAEETLPLKGKSRKKRL